MMSTSGAFLPTWCSVQKVSATRQARPDKHDGYPSTLYVAQGVVGPKQSGWQRRPHSSPERLVSLRYERSGLVRGRLHFQSPEVRMVLAWIERMSQNSPIADMSSQNLDVRTGLGRSGVAPCDI